LYGWLLVVAGAADMLGSNDDSAAQTPDSGNGRESSGENNDTSLSQVTIEGGSSLTAKAAEMRRLALCEVYTTERDYIMDLELIRSVRHNPIQSNP
jgi:hypothetical protein